MQFTRDSAPRGARRFVRSGLERGSCKSTQRGSASALGLGSSSSFTVGLLNALYALGGTRRRLPSATSRCEAIRIEQEVLKEQVGSQDQIWAAYGGFNRCGVLSATALSLSSPIILSADHDKSSIVR